MDSFELNKMAGAVFLCLLIVIGIKTVSETVFTEHEPQAMGYDVSGLVQEAAPAAADGGGEEAPSLMALLADADPERGARHFRRCVSCHTIEQGEENKIGPNLFGVVGRGIAGNDSFAYSDAFLEKGIEWTYENLDAYITLPAEYIPGNKMAFAGIRQPDQRADLIGYLMQFSPNAPAIAAN